jgi:23S rRNA pseudouridine1911/1915/1917 synthase
MKSKLTILYEDNHIVVVDKPAGLATVGVAADELSMAKVVKDYLKQKYDKPGNVYLGVVSRLDSMVSGILVLARTSKAAARLSEQFRSGKIAKRYWAIVSGQVDPSQGTLADQIAKDDAARRMRVVTRGGLDARLNYRVLGRHRNETLLEIELLTGRKHQIRTQLSERGWPILGDRKYGSRQSFEMGIALHSIAVRFAHPTRGEALKFRCHPPRSWNLAPFKVDFESCRFHLE